MCKQFDGKSSAEKWEILIIGICILLLLFGLVTFVVKQWWLAPELQKIEVVITPQDSLRSAYSYDKESLDSLISVINNYIVDNESRYIRLSNIQEDERFKSLASMLIGIISAIALFFGYKSFRDIREKGEEMSKEVAEKAANVIAEETAKKYLASQLPDIVKEELNRGLYNKQVINSTKASIIAELKPTLLAELKKEIVKKHELDDNQQRTEGTAMSPEEMFNNSTASVLAETTQEEFVHPRESVVENNKEESDGND